MTVVQIREKDADTGEFYDVALKSKAICDKVSSVNSFAVLVRAVTDLAIPSQYSVPLIINDRVDVFLAVSQSSPSPPLAGMHIGQSDLPHAVARQLLDTAGYTDAVIGVSCGNVQEAQAAKRDGADSIGIGAVWWTGSKKLKKDAMGVRGVEAVVKAFGGPAVAIGKHEPCRVAD